MRASVSTVVMPSRIRRIATRHKVTMNSGFTPRPRLPESGGIDRRTLLARPSIWGGINHPKSSRIEFKSMGAPPIERSAHECSRERVEKS